MNKLGGKEEMFLKRRSLFWVHMPCANNISQSANHNH